MKGQTMASTMQANEREHLEIMRERKIAKAKKSKLQKELDSMRVKFQKLQKSYTTKADKIKAKIKDYEIFADDTKFDEQLKIIRERENS